MFMSIRRLNLCVTKLTALRQRRFTTQSWNPQRQHLLQNNSHFQVSEEVRDAVARNQPVVALETTIYTHGLPSPDNLTLAHHLEALVRTHGGVPATIGIINGVARVGLTGDEIAMLCQADVAVAAVATAPMKVSRRDLAYATSSRRHGGTTIAGTMLLAHRAGIRVFATGGLGGVHRGAHVSMDVSADLTELACTPVAVVASGCKGFLDIPRTLEYLGTMGLAVATFADGRDPAVEAIGFPAFWARDSGCKSDLVVVDEAHAAALIHSQFALGIQTGLVLANPIPSQYAIPNADINRFIEEALQEAERKGISGKDTTPFILSKIKEITKGKSVFANSALVEANVRRGTLVARELANLDSKPSHPMVNTTLVEPKPSSDAHLVNTLSSNLIPEIFVVGSVAIDTSCDFEPLVKDDTLRQPVPQTSNPAKIRTSYGGVGYNIAKAAHFLGAKVKLFSLVSKDLGHAVLADMASHGMATDQILEHPNPTSSRTAQYIAFNDTKKDLSVAMADMRILENVPDSIMGRWKEHIHQSRPEWLVGDANFDSRTLVELFHAAKQSSKKTRTAFETVSVAKAARIFAPESNKSCQLPTFPNHIIDLVTPSIHEIVALYDAAQASGHLYRPDWWHLVNQFGITSTGARSERIRRRMREATSPHLVQFGVPQICLQLLPYMPTLAVKLGPAGVLLVRGLRQGSDEHDEADGVLRSTVRDSEKDYIVLTGAGEDGNKNVFAGVYMRLFPYPDKISQDAIQSVNGAGDTFLGALLARLTAPGDRDAAYKGSGGDIASVVDFAQRASGLTLLSKQSVNERLKEWAPRSHK